MNKEHAQKLIERLADKTLSFGCRIEENNHSPSHSIFVCHNLGTMYSAIQVGPENTYHFFNGYKNPEMKILGHPVYIGDVLKKLQQQEEYIVSTGDFETINDIITREDYNVSKVFAKLLHHWARCGIENSLQTILDEAELENVELKYPTILLFQLLETLFPNNTPNDTTNETDTRTVRQTSTMLS